MSTIKRIKESQHICEEYVYKYNPRPPEDGPMGRAPVRIENFDWKNIRQRSYLKISVVTEWGERYQWLVEYHRFNYSWVALLCDELGIPYSQFDSLEGQEIWVDVEDVDWENDEIVSELSIDDECMLER